MCMLFTNNENEIISGSRDKTIIIWRKESGSIIRRMQGHDHWVWCLTNTADDSHFISSSCDGKIVIWTINGD